MKGTTVELAMANMGSQTDSLPNVPIESSLKNVSELGLWEKVSAWALVRKAHGGPVTFDTTFLHCLSF